MRLIAAAAAAVLLAHAAPARAQDAAPADTTPRTALRKGAWSITFNAPVFSAGYGTGTFGVWEMVGARTNLGIVLGVNVSGRDREEGSSGSTDAATTVQLGVLAKRYVGNVRGVAPFVLAGVSGRATYSRLETDTYEDQQRGWGAGVEAGLGVEWFPVRQMSVGGHTGVTLGANRSSGKVEYPDGTSREASDRYGYFNTQTTQLSMHLYF